jgi:hypothetical protein
MRKYLYLIAILILTATGCREKENPGMDSGMYESNQVCLMVKGKLVYSFDEGEGQLAFNRTLKQFRAGNDDMTSFFVLTCSNELPRTKGQEIRANFRYTSGNSVKSSNDLTFKVEKYEEKTGLAWLWNSTDKTGAVVKILN